MPHRLAAAFALLAASALVSGCGGPSLAELRGDVHGPLQVGVVAGADLPYELPFIERLGARTARLEFSIDTPVSLMTPVVRAYARAGIRPLLLASFYGRVP